MKKDNWVLLAVAVAAIMFGVLVEAAVASGMEQFDYTNGRMLGDLVHKSTLAGVVGLVLSGVVMATNARILGFVSEVVNELMQVAWPTRDDTIRASTTVILTTLVTAAVLAAYDFLWHGLANTFIFTDG